MITRFELRKLAIALLDDSHGINHSAWCLLSNLLETNDSIDIIKEVKGTLGRYFLEETHSFQNEKPIDYE